MKFKKIFFVFVAICEISGHTKRFERDYGKNNIAGNENEKWRPWLVGFVYQPYDEFFCCGHFISSSHVLTGELKGKT